MSRLLVVFDLDDTLYPERQFAICGFRAAGRWAEAELGVKGVADEMIRMLDAGLLGRIFPTVLERLAPQHGPEHVKALHAAYRACVPELELFADARIALDHFGARGPIGLITDGTGAMQQRKIDALGIAPRFSHVVLTDELGPGRAYFKPHARPFEVMAAALGSPGDRFAYVGDNPQKDFVAPNAMGWMTVQVVRPGGIHDAGKIAPGGAPQHRVASLERLADVLG
jgi:putative hydrolase of the HAD superfamily